VKKGQREDLEARTVTDSLLKQFSKISVSEYQQNLKDFKHLFVLLFVVYLEIEKFFLLLNL
jgi:hypothetical protein